MSFVLPHQTQCSVEVIIRLQPPQSEHLQLIDQNTLYCINKQYSFDYIFPHFTTQHQVYEQVGLKMIASARKGYNSCIFVYGQTGSGKTYTMTGTEKQDGLIQNCMKNLLKMLESFESYQLKLSYFQIYNEQVNDLLAINCTGKKKQKNIKIKESLTLGFYLENLQEIKIQNEIDLIENLEKGIKNRTTAQTKMNKQSSRSHSILTLAVNTRERKQNGLNYSIKSFKMHFVDLAGSQKQKSTLTVGQRLKQASNINKSLTSLSIVIQKLSSKATHIPYRDSVLTKILRDSLGGNSKTILIATLSSKVQSISQTISTLNFAVKAKKVKQSVRINQQYEGSAVQMRRRIQQLQHQIRSLRQKQPNKCLSCEIQQVEIARLQQQVERVQNILKQKQSKVTSLEELVTNVQIQYENKLTQSLNKLQQLQNISLVHCTSNQSYNSFNGSIVQFLQQDERNTNNWTAKQQECIIIDEEQQYHESCQSYLPKFGNGLSVIIEQTAQNEMSSISPPTHQQNIQPQNEKKMKNKTRNRINKVMWDQSSVLSKPESQYQLKLQYIRCLKIIKNLKQQIIILERGIWEKNQELLQKHREQARKQSDQKLIYEPIIKKWIETNGSTIKTNLKNRNSIEGDIIMGMKGVINKLRAAIDQSKKAAEQKDKSYKKAIEQITNANNEYNADILKYKEYFSNDDNQNNDNHNSSFCMSNLGEEQNQNGYLSKSHPRIRTSAKFANNTSDNINNTNIKMPVTQNMQQQLGMDKLNSNNKNINFKSNNKLNCTIRSAPEQKNSPKQKPLQRIQNLQQQLDKQQVVKEQLTRQVENYKSRWQQLETETQQNRELAQYWQNQYANLCKTCKNIELRLDQQKQQKQRQLESMKIKEEEKIKLEQEISNISKSYEQCLKENKKQKYELQKYYQQREQDYRNQIRVLEIGQINWQQQIKRDNQIKINLENNIANLTNSNYNLKQQVQNLRNNNQILENNYQMVFNSKESLSKELNKVTVDLSINRQNLKSLKQQYQHKMKQNQLQKRKSQKQNESNYKKWLQERDINKMLRIDLNQLKQQNKQVRRKYNMLVAKNEDLNRVMIEIQSEQYTKIQELNNQNSRLLKKNSRYNDMQIQFKDKTEEIKHWKQKYQQAKKWEHHFKIMQQQFITNQKQLRESEKIRLNTSQASSSAKESLLKQFQSYECGKLMKEIVSKLSAVCGIEINQNNLIMNLDKIRDKIEQLRVVQAENEKFQRQFIQNRNSGSFNWGRFS